MVMHVLQYQVDVQLDLDQLNLHLKGFEAMGAKISFGHGYVEAEVKDRLKGAKIYLDFPSVGATENIMTAACSCRRYNNY